MGIKFGCDNDRSYMSPLKETREPPVKSVLKKRFEEEIEDLQRMWIFVPHL